MGLGKILVVFGIVMVVVGLALMFFERIPLFGKLPGDIHIKRENFELYVPITTSVVLSLMLSGIIWLISFLSKKQ